MPQITRQVEAVFAALLRDATEPRYGRDLAREAKLAGGTIYPLLIRLEEAGWLESEWEDIDPHRAGRRRRRYYKLTGEGARVARRHLAETLNRLTAALA
jgi:DNA-binding PadR family transcriptional regulator